VGAGAAVGQRLRGARARERGRRGAWHSSHCCSFKVRGEGVLPSCWPVTLRLLHSKGSSARQKSSFVGTVVPSPCPDLLLP